VLPVAPPLVQGDDHEQGGHGEVHPLGAEGDQRPGHRADDRAQNPVALVQQGDGKIEIPGVHPHRGPGRGQQGIGFVGEGEDHIELAGPHAPELLQHGQTVYQVPEVDEQRHDRHRAQGGGGAQQGHPQVLPGTSINGQAHEESPDEVVSNLLEHQPEGHPDSQIPHQHRYRGGESRF